MLNVFCFFAGSLQAQKFVAIFTKFHFLDIYFSGEVCPELTLREKCPNTEFFLVRIFLYSIGMQESTDQKKLRIWTLFTQCEVSQEFVQLTDPNKTSL